MISTRPDLAAASDAQHAARLAIYAELCRSYHAVDDFRTKLLGFLPLASLAGILLISEDGILVDTATSSGELIAFASFFAAAFTLALFLYEIRGILRCHDLVECGRALEGQLDVRGQFYVCTHELELAQRSFRKDHVFNAKVAASVIYSLVFSAWLFIALRLGIGWEVFRCGALASVVGIGLGVGAYFLVRRLIPA